MIYLILLAVISFGVMVYMLAAQRSLVEERKQLHNGHVPLGILFDPIRETAGLYGRKATHKTKRAIAPLFYKFGAIFHELLVFAGNKIFVFAAKMRGRGLVRIEAKSSAFLETLLEKRKANIGR